MNPLPVLPERACAGCTKCCVSLAVRELQKPAFTPCVHLGDRCCTIYPDRPPTCQAFKCLWLRGMLPEEFKPEHCGVVFAGSADGKGLIAVVDSGLHIDDLEQPVIVLLHQLAREWPETLACQGDYVTRIHPDGRLETRVQVKLTAEQRAQVKNATGKDAAVLELSAEELEEHIAPITRSDGGQGR
jgi:Fe-S-cluster containining protein